MNQSGFINYAFPWYKVTAYIIVNTCVTGTESLKQELDLQSKVVDVKKIHSTIESRELRVFEVALEHKSKLHIHKELQEQVGLQEYLEYVKGAHARLFLNFILLRIWVGMPIRVGDRNALIVGPLKC